MTIQKLKNDIVKLKEAITIQNAVPFDCKCLMIQFRDEYNRRDIIQKIHAASGRFFEDPGPIELHYANFSNLSRYAKEFLRIPYSEKMKAVEREFPPKHITEEETEELRMQFIERINGMEGRLRHEYFTA